MALFLNKKPVTISPCPHCYNLTWDVEQPDGSITCGKCGDLKSGENRIAWRRK